MRTAPKYCLPIQETKAQREPEQVISMQDECWNLILIYCFQPRSVLHHHALLKRLRANLACEPCVHMSYFKSNDDHMPGAVWRLVFRAVFGCLLLFGRGWCLCDIFMSAVGRGCVVNAGIWIIKLSNSKVDPTVS